MQKIKHFLAGMFKFLKQLTNSVSKKVSSLPTENRLPILIVAVFVIGAILLIAGSIKQSGSKDITISPAKASQTLGKELLFPLKDDDGAEVSKIKYVIENVEKRDDIVVKGQRARSVAGRTFLIFNLKIVNDYGKVIQIQSKDYIRLSVNGDKNQWLAPDIHNDPIDIQAISTKLTRVGFAINDSDSNLVLRVGEINGPKEEIEIKI